MTRTEMPVPAICLIGVFILAGCTPEPVPELLEAAAPKPGTLMMLRGEPLDQCLAAQKSSRVSWEEHATYNAGATYKAASRIHYAFDKENEHVPRLRIYEIRGTTSGLFGTGQAQVACFYEMRDGQPAFLHHLPLQEDGRVDINQYNGALRIVYRRLSGASYWDTFI